MSRLYRFLMPSLFIALIAAGGNSASSTAGEEEYTLIIKRVEVKKTKADGAAWDIKDGLPDLAVIVRNSSEKGSKTFKTKEHPDALKAEFNEPTTLKFRIGQTLDIQVVDIDVAANDDIGRITQVLTEKLVQKETVRFEAFGQVIVLEVVFRKL